MPDYFYVVAIDAPTREKADRVITERISHEEDYGFDYTLSWHYPFEVGFGPRSSADASHELLAEARRRTGEDDGS